MTSGDADQNPFWVTVTSVCGYHEKTGRRFLRTLGAQHLPRRLQIAAFDYTADLDIHNATKIIVRHLVNIMGIVGCDVCKTELATFDKIVKDRDGAIETDLRVSCACGKQFLLHSCSVKTYSRGGLQEHVSALCPTSRHLSQVVRLHIAP